jgi:bifunctional non-homologous end joining protein LigD
MPARRALAQALPEFIAPQLATLVHVPPKGVGWVYEIKLDGYRILARVNGKDVRMFTRRGNDWTADMQHLAEEVARLPTKSAWLDGEVVVLGDNGLPEFNALQNAFDRKGTQHLVYFVFDLLYLNGRDVRSLKLRKRRAMLEELFSDFEHDGVRLSQTFDADGPSVLQSACKMGLEGIVAKRLNAPYRSGARTETWQKVKCQLRQEFVVGGFTTRAGSGREVGSLILGVYDEEGRLRYAGSVGTGWTSTIAANLLGEMEKLETGVMPFHPEFPPTKGRWSKRPVGGEHWIKPSAVVEVTFTEWTPDGHIRHPTFRGVRRDKAAKDVRREV